MNIRPQKMPKRAELRYMSARIPTLDESDRQGDYNNFLWIEVGSLGFRL